MFKLISATPSPYARKVRIALIEKKLPFELITEVPWDNTTMTPDHNPLEKLPVLIPDSGDAVYESSHILEWLEARFPAPAIYPIGLEERLAARRLEVLCDGICDAVVLSFWERQRGQNCQSPEWLNRQRRKIIGGTAEMARLVGEQVWSIGGGFSLGDISVGTALGYLSVRYPEFDWREAHPNLCRYADRLDQRASFAATRPVPQTITDKVV